MNDDGGWYYYRYTLVYDRPETDDEFDKRQKWIVEYEARNEEHQRKQYEILKKKYE
ncbi:hypothetical protein [Acinetobacter sp.]|uniref:hypothetical protein n=1 Tax=Acinetobacter sp. TaxID=472 RepID=UPI0037532BDC